jgi:hypothetical protein
MKKNISNCLLLTSIALLNSEVERKANPTAFLLTQVFVIMVFCYCLCKTVQTFIMYLDFTQTASHMYLGFILTVNRAWMYITSNYFGNEWSIFSMYFLNNFWKNYFKISSGKT